MPDRCYHALDGYSYCWCSERDLCNSAMVNKALKWTVLLLLAAIVSILLT